MLGVRKSKNIEPGVTDGTRSISIEVADRLIAAAEEAGFDEKTLITLRHLKEARQKVQSGEMQKEQFEERLREFLDGDPPRTNP